MFLSNFFQTCLFTGLLHTTDASYPRLFDSGKIYRLWRHTCKGLATRKCLASILGQRDWWKEQVSTDGDQVIIYFWFIIKMSLKLFLKPYRIAFIKAKNAKWQDLTAQQYTLNYDLFVKKLITLKSVGRISNSWLFRNLLMQYICLFMNSNNENAHLLKKLEDYHRERGIPADVTVKVSNE